jgi:hypothetical protein
LRSYRWVGFAESAGALAIDCGVGAATRVGAGRVGTVATTLTSATAVIATTAKAGRSHDTRHAKLACRIGCSTKK